MYEPLPDKTAGKSVKTDFREWLKFARAWESKDAAGMLGVYVELPPTFGEALKGAIEFYAGASLPYRSEKRARRSIDFLFDSQLVYAAFRAQYGIDLSTARIHWYEFCALYYGLTGQVINDVCGYRTAKTNEIKDNARRREMKRLARIYALPDHRTVEERDRDNMTSIAELF